MKKYLFIAAISSCFAVASCTDKSDVQSEKQPSAQESSEKDASANRKMSPPQHQQIQNNIAQGNLVMAKKMCQSGLKRYPGDKEKIESYLQQIKDLEAKK